MIGKKLQNNFRSLASTRAGAPCPICAAEATVPKMPEGFQVDAVEQAFRGSSMKRPPTEAALSPGPCEQATAHHQASPARRPMLFQAASIRLYRCRVGSLAAPSAR